MKPAADRITSFLDRPEPAFLLTRIVSVMTEGLAGPLWRKIRSEAKQ